MFSSSLYQAIFGFAWHTSGKQIETVLTYRTYAGDPTSNITPDHIGQECFDTVNADFYKAVGLTSADWKQTTA